MCWRRFSRVIAYATVCMMSLPLPTVFAQEDLYYKNKTIRLIVGSEAGGLYDVYGRMVAQYLPDHIPGHPTVIVENMNGASGLRVTNYIYSAAPRDGTVIATTLAGMPAAKIFSPDTAKFEPERLSWLGSATTDTFVGIFWHNAPIDSLADAKQITTTVGGQSLGSFSTDLAVIANDLFGFKFKIVTGYKGAPEVKLAMERGEVQGTFGSAWGSIKSEVPEWLEQRKVKIITQLGLTKHRELPDVPLFIDEARTDQQRQLLRLLLARQEFSKPFFAPPDVPERQLTILRNAFQDTLRDPALIDAARKRNLDIDPRNAEQTTRMAREFASTPRELARPIFEAYDRFRN
jgi:tripartite-type tricarboxylate transporter receptor subunit TctC